MPAELILAHAPNAVIERVNFEGIDHDYAVATVKIDPDGIMVVVVERAGCTEYITIASPRIREVAMLEAAQHIHHLKRERVA